MTGQKNRQVVLAHFSIRNATFVERAAATFARAGVNSASVTGR